ncbi:MAG TPA: hypothetical protein VD994_03845, partial [Prosthecobacter sp.]|nr:hypothetical protein [Prosthecobacter sp.]
MTPSSQSLIFTHTPFSLGVSAAFVLVIVMLGWVAWRRSGFRPVVGLLELLRVLIAVGIAITLNQPEWKEVFRPESKPTLAVLVDVSRSMETRDVIDKNKPSAEPKARSE